jgi:hypothetical protein
LAARSTSSLLGAVDEGEFSPQADMAAGGNNRGVRDRAGLEIVDYLLLGERPAGFVVLHGVSGEDARKFGEVGSHEGAVAVCEELEDLGFVVRQNARREIAITTEIRDRDQKQRSEIERDASEPALYRSCIVYRDKHGWDRKGETLPVRRRARVSNRCRSAAVETPSCTFGLGRLQIPSQYENITRLPKPHNSL